ncbi:MAG: TraB/VirB10 family protein [Methylococcales bacterium]
MSKTLIDLWEDLSPNTKRGLVVGGLVSGTLSIFALISNLTPDTTNLKDKQGVVKHILTDTDPRSLGIDGLAAQITQMSQTNADLSRKMSSIEEDLKRGRLSDEERLKRMNEDQKSDQTRQIEALKGEIQTLRKDQITAAQSNTVSAAEVKKSQHEKPKPATQDLDNFFSQAQPNNLYGGSNDLDSSAMSGTPNSNQAQKSLTIRTIKAEQPKIPAGNAIGKNNQVNDKTETFIPAGSILSGNLINGLDAPTGKGAHQEPLPVMVRLKDQAILPNRYKADVRECFIIAAGYGDLSSERAYLRAESISCVRKEGGVIEVPIDAYAVGEDGKLGIRGRVVNKQGALLFNALAAGFMKGFSDLFGRTQTQALALAGPAGLAVTPFQRSFSSEAMEGGALKGAGYAMDRLANYYMDMAEELFPIIEVDATREVEFIFQKGSELKIASQNGNGEENRNLKR